MSTPLVTLLSFALWTVLVPLGAVGAYRFQRIFAGAAMNAFPADDVQGADWYKRAMRAHANCVENLPVYGALVAGIAFEHVESHLVDALAVTVIVFRIAQTLVHLTATQTARVVTLRFTLFFTQILAMLGMALRAFVLAWVA
jgi:uncharacterized MAPEG superfamily protein